MRPSTIALHGQIADLAWQGKTISEIAAAVDRIPGYVSHILRNAGVKAPRPPQRRVTYSRPNVGVACACHIFKDPSRADADIGREVNCTREFVGQVRNQMRSMGVVNR